MDWLVGIALLIAGGIIGFVVAKFTGNNQSNDTAQSEAEQTVKAIMSEQASTHLQETKQIVASLAEQVNNLQQQVGHYEQQIVSQNADGKDDKLNYFGDDAATYLRHKSSLPAKDKTNAEVQPLDFSAESSGLFSGNQPSENKTN